MDTRSGRMRAIAALVFFVYVLVVIDLTLVRSGYHYDTRQLNLVPFVGLINVIEEAGLGRFLWLFLGNVGWFFPFGFLLPIVFQNVRSGCPVVGLGLLLSLTIEMIQYFTRRGVAELDDVILNTLGTALGYLVYRVVKGVWQHRTSLDGPSRA